MADNFDDSLFHLTGGKMTSHDLEIIKIQSTPGILYKTQEEKELIIALEEAKHNFEVLQEKLQRFQLMLSGMVGDLYATDRKADAKMAMEIEKFLRDNHND